MEGQGVFQLYVVKEISVTEEFLGLGEEIRKCQTKETFGECNTRLFLDEMKKECHCVPYAVWNYSFKGEYEVFDKKG